MTPPPKKIPKNINLLHMTKSNKIKVQITEIFFTVEISNPAWNASLVYLQYV